MIVRPHPSFFEKTFAIHGSILVAILPKVLFACLTGLVASLVHAQQSMEDTYFTFTPFTALGVAISLFLGFRNNACYERWWEGRKQWGLQVVCTRNLARTCLTFLGSGVDIGGVSVSSKDGTLPPPYGTPDSPRSAHIISSLGVCHSHLLRGQLRGIWLSGHPKQPDPSYPADAVVEALKSAPEESREALARAKNPADAALRLAASQVHKHLAAKNIDTIAASAILKDLNDLSLVQGACERLATGECDDTKYKLREIGQSYKVGFLTQFTVVIVNPYAHDSARPLSLLVARSPDHNILHYPCTLRNGGRNGALHGALQFYCGVYIFRVG